MTTYQVKGMTCGGCASSVKKALERAIDEATVEVNLEEATVSVEGAHEASAVQRAVEDAGFDFVGAAP